MNFEKRGSILKEESIEDRASIFLNERSQSADIQSKIPRKSILHLLEKKSTFLSESKKEK